MELEKSSANLGNTTIVKITTVIFKPGFLRYILALMVPKVTHFSLLCFQFKVRSILRPSQFGGQPCTEPLVTFQPCIPSKLCHIEEIDCKNKFRCDTGNVLIDDIQPPLKTTLLNQSYSNRLQ